MHANTRSAFHVRTGDHRLADEADQWLVHGEIETIAVDDVYDACSTMIARVSSTPSVILIGLDSLGPDEFAIIEYMRRIWPSATIFCYGTPQSSLPQSYSCGVSIAETWTQLRCLLAAWIASQHSESSESGEPISDNRQRTALLGLHQLQELTPQRNGAPDRDLERSRNGPILNAMTDQRSADDNRNGTCGSGSGRALLQPRVTSDSRRSPMRAVLTLAERAALLGLEPARA